MSRPPKNHYVNNKDFLECIIKHREACLIAKEAGKTEPKIPDFAGLCIMKIAENLSHKPNFSSYTFREEFISDGVINCLQYYKNFDPEISSNPFAYFTQIIYYAFLRRIMIEKKNLYVKYKALQHMGIFDDENLLQDCDGNVLKFELYDNIAEFIKNYEDAKVNKKLRSDEAKLEKKLKQEQILRVFAAEEEKLLEEQLLRDFELLEKLDASEIS